MVAAALMAIVAGGVAVALLRDERLEVAVPSSSPPATMSVSSSPDIDPALIPYSGTPPIWSLSREETDAVFYDLIFISRVTDVTACQDVVGSYEAGIISGSEPLDECLRPHLAARGVSEEALNLLFQSGIAVCEAQATGPFWIATGFDYDDFGSNGGPPPYLFTPQGILDIAAQWNGWTLLSSAKDSSLVEAPMPYIRRAYADIFGMSETDVGFWGYGDDFSYGIPVETSGGWTVPFSVSLVGCHACATPIRGSFELASTEAGLIEGARFVGLCYDASYVPDDPGDIPAGNEFGLAVCGQPAGTPVEDSGDGDERIVDASCGEEYCAGIWKTNNGEIVFEAWGMGDYFGVITVCVEKVTRVCLKMDPQEMPAGYVEWRLPWSENFPEEGSGIYKVTMTSGGGNPVGEGSWDFEWNADATA